MGSSSTRILKGALWFQAALLLVLTSILADSNAWAGAIITGTGFFLVALGITAAHKRRIGYLYCYATLVGLWEILALTHSLVICGLIVLPPKLVNAAFVVGQRVIDNPVDIMEIVMPLIYGFQWGGWCITLVCLVSLRLATSTRGSILQFETQDPKRPHSLEVGRSQSSSNSNHRMSQHLLSFRHSVISPMGGSSSADAAWSMMHVANSDVRNGLSGSGGAQSESTFRSTGGGGEGPAVSRKGKEPASRRYSNDSDIPQAPQRAWAGADRRSSSDSNTIYIPNDSRISQVVVTFRNDTKSSLEQHSPSQMASRIQQQHQQAAAPTSLVGSNKLSHPEANAVYIADHYHNRSHSAEKGSSSNHSSAGGVSSNSSSSKHDFILNFASGESLSDMIFKPPQDTDLAPFIMAPKTMLLPPPPPLHNLESPQSMKRLGLTLGNASSPYRPRRDVSNPARIRATSTKASLTLSSDSSSSEMSSVSSSSESGDMEQEQTEARAAPKGKETGKSSGRAAAVTENNSITDRAIVSVTPLNIISKAVQTVHPDQETLQVFQDTPSAQLTKATHLTTDSEHKQDLSLSALDDEDDPGEQRPQTQPNTCDFFPPLSFPSSASMKSSFEDYTENCLRRTYFDLKSPLANDLSNTQALGDGSFSSSLTSLPEPSSVLALASTSVPSASTLALVSATPPNATTLSAASSSSSSVHTSTSALVSTTINTSKSATMATAASTPAPRLRSSIVSLPLHYWRNRSSSHGADSSVSTTSPFSQNCIASTFSKKKKLIIPTIVIHPDKEDGEPPRVLSQKDIEYLSTTPPPPMQPLVHAWDVITEEDKYEADETMVGQRHDHNSYHPYYQQQQQQQPHQRHPVIYDPILEFDDDYRQQAVKIEGQSGRDHSRQGHDDINDSYALDVPIEAIEVDMDPGESSLNDVKCGRRYL